MSSEAICWVCGSRGPLGSRCPNHPGDHDIRNMVVVEPFELPDEEDEREIVPPVEVTA